MRTVSDDALRVAALGLSLLATACSPAGRAWEVAQADGGIDAYHEFIVTYRGKPEVAKAVTRLRLLVDSFAVHDPDALPPATVRKILGVSLPVESLSVFAVNNIAYLVAVQSWRDGGSQDLARQLWEQAQTRGESPPISQYVTCTMLNTRTGLIQVNGLAPRVCAAATGTGGALQPLIARNLQVLVILDR